ncbi:MAG: hypothetical protein AAFU03_18985 [Bacteroidota bacterium]
MGFAEIKELLHLRIEQADEKQLRILAATAEAMFEEYSSEGNRDEDVIGYVAGESMSIAQLKAKINIAEDQIDRGEFLTPQELEKEAEEWLKESIT